MLSNIRATPSYPPVFALAASMPPTSDRLPSVSLLPGNSYLKETFDEQLVSHEVEGARVAMLVVRVETNGDQ